MELFGFTIKKKPASSIGSPVAVTSEAGEAVLNTSSGAGFYQQTLDLEALVKSENELIKKYRDTSMYPDCDSAIEDIINEAIVVEEDKESVILNLDGLKLPENVKKKFQEEFKEILNLLKFNERGHDIFRQWYVDGRTYYNILLDGNNPKRGIQDLIFMDPRKTRKIREIKKTKTPSGVEVVSGVDEYFIYNNDGITENNIKGTKLSVDSVVYCPSGFVDNTTGTVLSYLHKAIKPVNQLKLMEDALVIYRLAKSAEKRIFYIDVGNMPAIKAEQYVTEIMSKYRNKITYDAQTGEIRDDRKQMSMLEDFWIPRRNGSNATEITTLQGGQTLAQIDDINFFKTNLYQALNVPVGRLQPQQGFSLGRASEITRDELKFSKFVSRIRKKFSKLFLDVLRVQLIAKGIINPDDWDHIKSDIRFDYIRDNYFAEFKNNEIINQRLQTLTIIDQYVGKYFSIEYVKKQVLNQTDEEIAEEEKQIEDEDKAGLYAPQDTEQLTGAPQDDNQ